jgi:hypothetical protein
MSTWWLITWTTYATWLPGDPRGFQTWRAKKYIPPPKRYAKPGEATYDKELYRTLHAHAQNISGEAVWPSGDQQASVLATLITEIEAIPLRASILSIGKSHVHLLAMFGSRWIRQTIGRLKAQATRELNRHGFVGKRPWSKNCHMTSKNTPQALENAYNYVLHHQTYGDLIKTWLSQTDLLKTLE